MHAHHPGDHGSGPNWARNGDSSFFDRVAVKVVFGIEHALASILLELLPVVAVLVQQAYPNHGDAQVFGGS